MIWLSNSTLVKLRDRLKARGRKPSLAVPSPDMDADRIELMNELSEYGPICDAMYLMMSADGKVGPEEREVLKGALRNLSDDGIRGAHIDAMLDRAGANVAELGRDGAMAAVIAALREDRPRGEVAFVLAAAIAFADNAIADEENETLNAFAEGIGIDESRANTLLDEVEADLANDAPPEG